MKQTDDGEEPIEGDIENWLECAADEFRSTAEALQTNGTPQERLAAFQRFEKQLARAAAAGDERYWAYELAGYFSPLPSSRLACFARAYELLQEERKERTYPHMPCSLMHHYEFADYLHEMGLIHESNGDMARAAELYRRSLQHLQDGAEACDAQLNHQQPGVPRRPAYTESLARVQKFLA